MTVRLRIGNSLDGTHPTRGVIKEVRFGSGDLASVGQQEAQPNLFPPSPTSNDGKVIVYHAVSTISVSGDTITLTNDSGSRDMYFGEVGSSGAAYSSNCGWLIPVDASSIYDLIIYGNDSINKNFVSAFDANKNCLGYTQVYGAFTTQATTAYITLRIGYGSATIGTSYSFRVGLYKGTYTGVFKSYNTQYDYSFHTLDLNNFETTYPAGQDINVNRIEEFFSNTNDRRMTSNADIFIPLTDVETDKYYHRQDIEGLAASVDAYRNYGQNTDQNDDIGLSLKLTKVSGQKDDNVWFDNAVLNVSDILWEFNPTGGDGRWYQLYMLPGRETCRVTLPEGTNTLRARALSNDTQTWIQRMGIWPVPDLQKKYPNALSWTNPNLQTDAYNYVTWNPAQYGSGAIIYYVYDSDGNLLGHTRFCHWQLNDGVNVGYVVAMDSVHHLEWDDTVGAYTNDSIVQMLEVYKDGLNYGISIPTGTSTIITKTDDNADLDVPIPAANGSAAVDTYAQRGPFVYFTVNGFVDVDGTPHVTAIKGQDESFALDGSNGNVFILAPTLYYEYVVNTDTVQFNISDTQLDGFSLQPQAKLPSGDVRPYMLYAKYPLVKGADINHMSVSGLPMYNRSISHNSLITLLGNATSGYSAKSIGDDWYIKTMFMMKYATKNSQSVFYGCSGYNFQYAPTVAETGVTRVIISTTNANNLIVGSTVSLGSGAVSVDRNATTAYDIFSDLRIKSITTYDSSNSAINLDTSTTFNTATTDCLSTMPWYSGKCDSVVGDGSILAGTNAYYPFILQGIECMTGLYEIVGDIILSNDGTTGWEIYVNYDSKNETSSVTSNYIDSGKSLITGSIDAWHYPLYPDNAGGLLFGTSDGGSQSTGMCDGTYTNKLATTGTREWLGFGALWYWGIAGLFYVVGSSTLTYSTWIFGSRLSVTGRSRG